MDKRFVKLEFDELENMYRVSKLLDYFVFMATTVAIAGVFCEGMALKWFDIVAVFIIVMDISFSISTVVNLFVYRKTKWIYINIFSSIMIVIAIAMKFCSVPYPIWSLVIWYFYIWFIYGLQITCKKK